MKLCSLTEEIIVDLFANIWKKPLSPTLFKINLSQQAFELYGSDKPGFKKSP
ncbi:hypothetical protein ACEW7V_03085 [Areca yellow leaf disease phytoplasma]|uniref:hypothetical protein n=1 Tax=Areca yellow leaf disease phytoplasma TaxID=927614 RepID=UPI0035B544EF